MTLVCCVADQQVFLLQLAFVTTTADTLRQIRLWIQYHRAVGVTDFILFVEGQAAKPEVANALDRIEGVQVSPTSCH